MAKDLNTVMTWKQACREFEELVLPWIHACYEQDGVDWPARREAWNNWTDGLCKDNQISDWQYANWPHPPCNGD